jgi:hypothetical protein
MKIERYSRPWQRDYPNLQRGALSHQPQTLVVEHLFLSKAWQAYGNHSKVIS